MKKLLLILLLVICSISLVGCNKQLIDFELDTYNYVYIISLNETYKVDKWRDYEGEQLQIILSDGTKMLISSVDCILYNGENNYFEKEN